MFEFAIFFPVGLLGKEEEEEILLSHVPFEFLCCYCRQKSLTCLLCFFISLFFCVNPRPGGAIFAKFALLSARYIGQYEPASFSRFLTTQSVLHLDPLGLRNGCLVVDIDPQDAFNVYCRQWYPDKFSNQLKNFLPCSCSLSKLIILRGKKEFLFFLS